MVCEGDTLWVGALVTDAVVHFVVLQPSSSIATHPYAAVTQRQTMKQDFKSRNVPSQFQRKFRMLICTAHSLFFLLCFPLFWAMMLDSQLAFQSLKILTKIKTQEFFFYYFSAISLQEDYSLLSTASRAPDQFPYFEKWGDKNQFYIGCLGNGLEIESNLAAVSKTLSAHNKSCDTHKFR